jgi:SAM-dependent methyltransferase
MYWDKVERHLAKHRFEILRRYIFTNMPTEPEFVEEIDSYIVLKLILANYHYPDRNIPPEVIFVSKEYKPEIRKEAKRLLRLYFRQWAVPYHGYLPGWREDSAVYLLWQGQLACGVYLCDQNEFGNEDGWGQLHYAFVNPQFKGKGLYSLVFKEAVLRAKSWGLSGIYLNSDRYMLPEVYERWGAVRWKAIPKIYVYPKHKNRRSDNWLVYRIHDRMLAGLLRKYASGILLDIGCGDKPYSTLTEGIVTAHIGLDHPNTFHNKSQVDLFATAYKTSLFDNSVDTVLCTVVIEHLEWPQDGIIEMYRILKPGGYVILSAPLFWHLHEEPRDFYRYTKYGLEHLFTTAGFEIVEIKPLSGFFVTFSQELVYFLNDAKHGFLRYPIALLESLIQIVAMWLNHWDRSYRFTWAYMVVARKNGT